MMRISAYIYFSRPERFDLPILRTTVLVVPRRAMSRSAVVSAARSAHWHGRSGQVVLL